MTPKTKTILIISGALVLTAASIGAYHLWFKDKNSTGNPELDRLQKELDKLQKNLGNKGGEVAAPGEGEYSANVKQQGDGDLKVGSEGRKVALLQALLNHYEKAGLKIDGVFGNATRLALLKSGFIRCSIAANCEITMADLAEYLTKSKNDTTFNKNYSVATNQQMKAVYDKYSS